MDSMSPMKYLKVFRMVLFLKARSLWYAAPPQVQVRGAQKVGTAQPILSCPILFLSAAGIDPCWFWHSRAKATRGQRLVLLGAAARGTDVLLSTCLLLRHHAVIPVWFQSLLGCVCVWCVSAQSCHTDQRVFPIVIFWEREKRKGMSEVEVCTRGSWILGECDPLWPGAGNSESTGTGKYCSLFSCTFTLKDALCS